MLNLATLVGRVLGMLLAVRSWRTRDVTGLTPEQGLLRVVGKVAWVAYEAGVADLGLDVANVVVVIPSLVTLRVLMKAATSTVRRPAGGSTPRTGTPSS